MPNAWIKSLPPLFLASALASSCASESTGQNPAPAPPGGSSSPLTEGPGRAYYAQHCATCHGQDMEGGLASSLLDGEWAFGGTRDEIFRSIHDGVEHLGMPAYGDSLDDEQIHLIIDAMLGEDGAEGEEEASARDASQPDDIVKTLDYEVAVERWVDNLSIPWGIAFLDDRRALVTERPGPLRLVVDGELHPDPIADTPSVVAEGQGGMMAVSIDPEFEDNGWIYLGYSHGRSSGGRVVSNTRIVRGRIADHRWVDQEVVYEAPEDSYSHRRQHFGVRIVFDAEGHLYFPIGDRGVPADALRLDSPNGKIHRIHRDGSIPRDNPFLDEPDALPSIYAYGVRNPQGLAIHPLTGDLWEAEHGPRGGDEINIIRAGANYGWPEVTHGINYNGSVITRERARPGVENPVWMWRPSTAVCAIDFYTGNQFPFWRNHLLATALRNETLRLLKIRDDRVIHEEILLADRGRIRDVQTGPDGAIYLLMNSPDEILRLTSLGEDLQ